VQVRVELQPGKKIKYTDKFENPEMPGEMQTTINLRDVSTGTELEIFQEGLPDAIPAEMCYLGWQESLTLLTKLVEAEMIYWQKEFSYISCLFETESRQVQVRVELQPGKKK
jgi:hypothetical protein